MTARKTSGVDGERGAVLIQVAVALLALLALSAFVFDYGVMWASRGQAQNSADAGALAGAISLAFDSPTDQTAARARGDRDGHAAIGSGARTPSVTRRRRDVPGVPCRDAGHSTDTLRARSTCSAIRHVATRCRRSSRTSSDITTQGVARHRDGAGRRRQRDRVPEALGDRRPLAGVRTRQTVPDTDADFDTTIAVCDQDRDAIRPQEHGRLRPASRRRAGTGFTLPDDYGRQFALKGRRQRECDGLVGLVHGRSICRGRTARRRQRVSRATSRAATDCRSGFAGPTTGCPASIANLADRERTGPNAGLRDRDRPARRSDPTATRSEELTGTATNGVAGGCMAYRDMHDSTRRTSARGLCRLRSSISTRISRRTRTATTACRDGEHLGFFIEGMGDVDPRYRRDDAARANGKTVIGRLMTYPGHRRQAGSWTQLPRPTRSFLSTRHLVR